MVLNFSMPVIFEKMAYLDTVTGEVKPGYIDSKHGKEVIHDGEGRTASEQATMQLIALIVTMVIAISGGVLTGMIMKLIAKFQDLGEYAKKMEMLQKLGKVGASADRNNLASEAFFDDHLFFEVNEVNNIDKSSVVVEETSRF